jgi:transcription antitermination factor NusG
MPLLPLEQYVFPDNLLASPDSLPEGGSWWVLHTRPRAEKALARSFLGRGVSFFLPLQKREFRCRGRAMRSYLPLFPGYVFLHGEGPQRLQALETNLVARALPVPNQEELHTDLARVHRLMVSGANLAPEQRLAPGSAVKLIGGPFVGLEGTVLRAGRQLRLVVLVHFLHQGVSIEIDPWMVEPAEAAAGDRACQKVGGNGVR